MNIVFARPRYFWDTYQDFWRLVDLSNYKTVWFDEINFNDSNTTYITAPIQMSADCEPLYVLRNELPAERRCRIVWWFLERPDGSKVELSRWLSQGLRVADEAWCSDRLVASMDARLKFVVLGGHAGLRTKPSVKPIFDFTHQGNRWGRRAAIYDALVARGLSEGPSCFGDERETILASSRIMLNLQQYNLPVIAPLRFILAAAYKLPIITETLHDQPDPISTDLIQADYNSIVDTVSCLRSVDLSEFGKRIHNVYCKEWTFRRGVEEALCQSS